MLARLAALAAPVRWIRGNGEREVGEAIGKPMPERDDMAGVTAVLTVAAIGVERPVALGGLPLTVELDGVLYCHASPRRDDEMLTRLSTTRALRARRSRASRAPLVVAGHTHQQDDRTVGPAALHQRRQRRAAIRRRRRCALAVGRGRGAELRQTPYDHVGAGTRILAAGWPDEQSTRAALVEPMEPILITRIFEERAG